MDTKQNKKVEISIIIPVYNEADNLSELHKRLSIIFKQQLKMNYEIIFIDDGSTDLSWKNIKTISDIDSNVRGVKFSKNFGHQIALSAGMDYACGDAVIMMDADLQHPPELIPQLIQRWKEGYDIVYTIRKDNKDCRWLKKITSRFFYLVLNKLSKVDIIQGTADFRLLSSTVVTQLRNIKERTRFLRGLISWVGYKKIGIPFIAEARFSGKSKYSLLKMIRFAIIGIVSFSAIPLYISTVLGFIIAGMSFLYGIYAIYVKFFTNQFVPGWASILVSVLFLGGVQLIVIGILGEYLAKVYEEVKQRPLYIVEETKDLRDN